MQTSRYFVNRFSDYSGTLGDIRYVHELIPRVLSYIENQRPPQSKQDQDGGLYVGPAGIAYAFYHVAESGIYPDQRKYFLGKSLEYLETAQKYVSSIPPQSNGGIGAAFLLGHSGVYAMSALLYQALGLEKERDRFYKMFLDMHNLCKPINFFPYGSDELLIGRAGYLSGLIELGKKMKMTVPQEITQALFQSILSSGLHYAQGHRHGNKLLMYAYYNTEYLGAAHGLSSILQMLLNFPEYFKNNPNVEEIIHNSVNFMLAQEQNGNYPPALGDSCGGRDELVHWCHGAPGVVYLMAKAYLTWKDEKYLQAAVRCGEIVWEKGLLKKGPGICHGIAGNGYVFLLLYRLTKNKKYLYRAFKFADFIQTEEFQRDSRTPDCPYSLYEGLAGTLCFYTDLLAPDKAAFPFFDVFT